LVGPVARGIPIISEMFNITRIHNAISACALLHRALAIAADFAGKRDAFGRRLARHPLHMQTLARIQMEWEGCMHVVFYAIALLGRDECQGPLPAAQKTLLRILMPLIKLYTGKAAMRGISEALEGLGGTGYMEDSGMPQLLRDAQVLPIWEGTTNVLSVDVFRVLKKTPEALSIMQEETLRRVASHQTPGADRVRKVCHDLKAMFGALARATEEQRELIARDFSMALITSFTCGLLFESVGHPSLSSCPLSPLVPERYAELYVSSVPEELPSVDEVAFDRDYVLNAKM